MGGERLHTKLTRTEKLLLPSMLQEKHGAFHRRAVGQEVAGWAFYLGAILLVGSVHPSVLAQQVRAVLRLDT